jgi:hypothetical protein
MSEKSATNSGMLSLVPPVEIQALFGDPPLLRGEDIGLYNELMGHFAKLVDPKDMIEWWWVKDITDHSWEIRRLRRFKVLFVEIGRDQLFKNTRMLTMVEEDQDAEVEEDQDAEVEEDQDAEYVPPPVPDSEKDSALLFMYRVNQYKSVDTLIASAEARRAKTLREIERRREHLARRLRKASDEIIDGEFAALREAAE